MQSRFSPLELIFIESGGDNLAAAFSPELADRFIYIIDVAQGEKIPRKGGPGIMRSDLLVINKTDLAPHVGASLEVMEADSRRMRGGRPFVFSNLFGGEGTAEIAAWLEHEIAHAQGRSHAHHDRGHAHGESAAASDTASGGDGHSH